MDEDLKACEDILQFMQDHHGLSPKRRRHEKDRAEDTLARAHKKLKDAYADNQMDPQVRLRWEQIIQGDITMTPADRALQRREDPQFKREERKAKDVVEFLRRILEFVRDNEGSLPSQYVEHQSADHHRFYKIKRCTNT